uniref:Uncharacterized protein n=1 Tax=Tetradesmus obliquus TaxID=3088 RepID=A0A383WL91_TETOB|eukprot:jgi/Sobl393_1/12363/SZX78225.1
MEAKVGVPTNFVHWLHQTYTMRWKGALDISTVPGPDHANKSPQWCCSLTAAGAVVRDRQGRHVTLEPLQGSGQARSKKEAEQQAARQVYEALVAGGWYDPEAPPPPKKGGGVSRAMKFITDNTPANTANPLAYLDISIDGQAVGRVVLELFRYKKGSTLEEHAPLAVSNFLALCRGVEVGGVRLCYAGCPFTRIMERFLLQAGDVVNRDGTGAGWWWFSHPFMLGAANLGLEDSNASQFMITTAPAAQLAGQHTCFGKVLAGYGVVKEIEALCDRHSSTPPCPVIIEEAGELPPGTDLSAVPPVAAGGWPLWPEDQGAPPQGVREAAFRLGITAQLKEAGNAAYKQGDAAAALARYQQAARFLSWTSFKLRDEAGDVELSAEEQRALWDCEVLLMGNAAAAQLKLGRFKAAGQTCRELLQRAPSSVKGLLRAGQAAMGLGPGEYGSAAEHLQQALQQAREQQLPTRDIVEELHRLHSLQQPHAARQRTKFSSAFAAGLLHHPADDAPPPAAAAAAAPLDPSDPAAAAAAAAGLRHVVVPPGRRVAGPVAAERVLEGGQPVLVDDAWGRHLLLADDDDDDDDGEGQGGWAAGGGSSSYSRGLMARLARMGLAGSSGLGAAASSENDGWGEAEQGHDDDSDEEGGWAEGCGEGMAEQQQQQGNGHHAGHPAALAPQGAEGVGSPNSSSKPEAQTNGSSGAATAASSSGLLPLARGLPGPPEAAAPPEEAGLPEEAEAAQAAAAGVAVAAGGDAGQRSYGDGALGAMMRKIPL